MQTSVARFLKIWLGACLAIVLIAAVLSVSVDPYLLFGTPRIEGFNARKPAVMGYERMMKAYDVTRVRPNSLILGSSNVALGMDPQYAGWPLDSRPVYNLSIMGGPLYASYRYLQHVLSQRNLAVVVIGLDLENFLGSDAPGFSYLSDYDELRLAVTRDGIPNSAQDGQRMRDMLRTLSLSALGSSVETLKTNFRPRRGDADIVGGLVVNTPDRPDEEGSLPVFATHEINMIRSTYSRAKTINPAAMLQLQSIMELCGSQRVKLILFINPVHADALEIYDKSGLWPTWEEWKKEITELTARYGVGNSPGQVALWDFANYDKLSTESVKANRYLLKGYWELVHYRPIVGNAIVDRIFGNGDDDFGVMLTPETVTMHLVATRKQQQAYREHHREDVRRLNDLYSAVMRYYVNPH